MDLSNNPKTKARLLYIIGVVVVGCIGVWYLSYCTCHADWYSEHIFQPWQLIRNSFLQHIPVSIGDIIYFFWGFGLVSFVVRLMYYAFKWNDYSAKFWNRVVKGVASLATIYLFFMIGWGGNYYKEPLGKYWQLDKSNWNDSELVRFDEFLVQQLNNTAPYYQPASFKDVAAKAMEYYTEETDCNNSGEGLHLKRSLFGNMLKYIGVQGYYNPFTGEGQVNKSELHFLLPYLTAHELAHQAGVGAEDDANLLAYTVCIESKDSSFMYSAYFNLWLYTHMQLRIRDTVMANAIKKELNPTSLQHLEELKKERKKYRSKLNRYTGDMYDQYLKFNHQKDGIESYDKVTVSAWAWEHKRLVKPESKIYIP
jgi:hypothetical protein